MEHPEKNEDKRILEETVMGVIPAVAFTEKSSPIQCGLVFATNVMIVASSRVRLLILLGHLGLGLSYYEKGLGQVREQANGFNPKRIQMLHYSLLRGNALGSSREGKNTEEMRSVGLHSSATVHFLCQFFQADA